MDKQNSLEEIVALKLRDVTLPDEDMMWQDMKRRLEEDKDDRIVPFFLRRGCGIWMLLAGLAVSGGLLYYYSIFFSDNKKDNLLPVTTTDTASHSYQHIPQHADKGKPGTTLVDTFTIEQSLKPQESKKKNLSADTKIDSNEIAIVKQPGPKSVIFSTPGIKKTVPIKKESYYPEAIQEKKLISDTSGTYTTPATGNNNMPPGNAVIKNTNEIVSISSAVLSDSNTRNIIPVAVSTNGSNSLISKEKTKSKNKATPPVSFATGIALWQNLEPGNGAKVQPDAGLPNVPVQTVSSVNESKLLDYIPTVYGRLYKGDKWFLQSEFRFRAPVQTDNITYNKKINTSPFGATTTSKIVTKTYYHQLSFTGNYFILPNWSLGAGMIGNKFSRAVTIEEVRQGVTTGSPRDTIISLKKFGVLKADTNFVKSFLQARVETQFRWKKLSLGVNYTFGIQPYLKYMLPGGIPQQEKNNSFNVFLRYEIWESKEK
jgi:hypothetical protein